MNSQLLKKLQDNPHYKLSPEQMASIPKPRQEVVEFGVLPLHDNGVKPHATSPKRIPRRSAKK